jgi:hypothetical protein
MYRALACVLLLLAACDHSANDGQRCVGYGYEPGTEGFAQCRMTVSENRRAMGAVMIAGAE